MTLRQIMRIKIAEKKTGQKKILIQKKLSI